MCLLRFLVIRSELLTDTAKQQIGACYLKGSSSFYLCNIYYFQFQLLFTFFMPTKHLPQHLTCHDVFTIGQIGFKKKSANFQVTHSSNLNTLDL